MRTKKIANEILTSKRNGRHNLIDFKNVANTLQGKMSGTARLKSESVMKDLNFFKGPRTKVNFFRKGLQRVKELEGSLAVNENK